ncbi:MAG: TonB-dependent receptor domain-containing protein [Terracidiphilus sp.]
MPRFECAGWAFCGLLFLVCAVIAGGQSSTNPASVTVTVVDENGQAVEGAQVTIAEPGAEPAQLWTDYAGNCEYALRQGEPYRITVEKAGFYKADESGVGPDQNSVRVVMAHEQIVRQQVNVTASAPGIDTQQVSDQSVMNTAEIVNIPYPTSRDIRNLLPFNPGVVQDETGQVHVAGSETWETLDTMDGFDIRSPVGGSLSLRVSTDAVRTIDSETTRYPVEFGRATGGVIAFYTGMGDNKFRFNATDFIPSFRELNGLHFDKFVPRFTFSGPLKRDHAWWYDGVETEWDNIYISELPANANTDELVRGSNLIKAQVNATQANILTGGLLYNNYHSPYDGISSLMPQESTVKRNTIAWMPYARDQQSFGHGALLDLGAGFVSIRDGYEPHGSAPYEYTPEQTEGSYFENLSGRSQRLEGTATLYLPPRQWMGRHDVKAGLDVDHIAYDQRQTRTPVSYLGEGSAPGKDDGPVERLSTFVPAPAFTMHNGEIGVYVQDRWQPGKGWLVEPGLRFDWDEIVRKSVVAPRLALVYAPPGDKKSTKISAGIGLYYEHTYLYDLAQTYAGIRYDTCFDFAECGQTGQAEESTFAVNGSTLKAPRALNWSVGVERKLPWSINAGANFMEKRTTDVFTFALTRPTAQAGAYLLNNERDDRYSSEEFDARKLFGNDYTVYVSYTHSSARTNAALDYLPTPSPLGPQQSGPLPWDVPNRVISWGWLPVPFKMLRKRWDFVYLLDEHTGFLYTAVNAAQQVVGAAGGQRFPDFVNFSPGLEWKFHFRGQYWGLRGILQNATNCADPAVVNNVVDSPEFATFSELQGRAFTARIRLIGTK